VNTSLSLDCRLLRDAILHRMQETGPPFSATLPASLEAQGK
jgi:hypothetical protein